MSVGCSAVFGFFLLVSLLFSIQDFDTTVNTDLGQPLLQILIDIFGENGAIVLMTLILVCVWHCGLFSMTSNSRMAGTRDPLYKIFLTLLYQMFAFSRDGALPSFFHQVDKRFRSPIRTVWLAATLSFLLAIPSLGSSVAFTAATSIATIGLYLSYGFPILIGIIWSKNFKRGPFDLGIFSKPVATVACLWIAFITVVFCLPEANPVNSQTLNYTPVAVGIIAVFAFGSWFLWAKRWFTGPIRQIAAEAAGINLDEPGALEEAELKGKIPSTVNEKHALEENGEQDQQGNMRDKGM